jgi:hypothetical protein
MYWEAAWLVLGWRVQFLRISVRAATHTQVLLARHGVFCIMVCKAGTGF